MKVVILCGGAGTRLHEETEFRPKPLVEVGGRPILWHIMKHFAHYGFRDFILCLGYRGYMIKDYFLNYQAMNADFTIRLGHPAELTFHTTHQEQDLNITLADTGAEILTGGRLKRIERYLDADSRFLLTYGDGVSDIDLKALLHFHQQHGKLATVSTFQPVSRFGILALDADHKVTRFKEKPRDDAWASAGFFVLERRALSYIQGDNISFESEPLQRLASEGQLMAYQHHGFFYAMDTYREFQLLNEAWNQGNAPWKSWP